MQYISYLFIVFCGLASSVIGMMGDTTITITKMDDIHIANQDAIEQGVKGANNAASKLMHIATFKC